MRYEKPGEAIAWLVRVFGFREQVRMSRPDGTVITSKLEGPTGGLVMVAGVPRSWLIDRLPQFFEPKRRSWPHLSHVITAIVTDVDAHYEHASAEGATILMLPTDQPWGLRVYAAIDLEGHQWEFGQFLRPVLPEAWGATRIE